MDVQSTTRDAQAETIGDLQVPDDKADEVTGGKAGKEKQEYLVVKLEEVQIS